jgi:catechol 2,3-dioxygenase-like lactoylglutathione lyase family enzyme
VRPTALDHAGLLVSDVERSLRFYTEVLGLEEVPRPSTFDFPGAWVAVGDQQLHLIGEAEPGRVRRVHPGYDASEAAAGYASHLALVVEDVDAMLERMSRAGTEPAAPARSRGDGVRQAYVRDPDGYIVELMQVGVEVTGGEPRIAAPRRTGA